MARVTLSVGGLNRFLPRRRPLVKLLSAFWVLVILWFEVGTFYSHVGRCAWPGLEDGARVLIVADPQVLDRHSYPDRRPALVYVSQVFTDLNLRKSWRAALRTQPHAVVFLGDMMDSGRLPMSDEEYETYFRRFNSIFKLPASIIRHFIPGNHDTDLGAKNSFSTQARLRYTSHFGPTNVRKTFGNSTLVFIDAPGFVEEDRLRIGRHHSFNEWVLARNGSMDLVASLGDRDTEEPLVLFTHIPLSRPDSSSCGPWRERGTIRAGRGSGYENTLGKEASTFILERLRPDVIYSGDDHDYCEHVHEYRVGGEVHMAREVTVKSLSMAMGIRIPGFQMLTLSSAAKPADQPCFLPDQLGIYLGVYVPLIAISLIVLGISQTVTRPLQPPLTRVLSTDHSHGESSASASRNARARFEFGQELPAPASSSGRESQWRNTAGVRSKHPREILRGFVRDFVDTAVLPVLLFSFISWWYLFEK